MEPATYGIVSIVPVIVLIVVALITKRTFESLLIATLLALVLGYKGDWFYALIEQIQTVSADNVWVLLVVGLLGGPGGGFGEIPGRHGLHRGALPVCHLQEALPAGGVGPQRGPLRG